LLDESVSAIYFELELAAEGCVTTLLSRWSAEMTSPSTPRARRRAERRQSILDTALELIGTRGLDGLTVHALAGALDLTPGALYRYFKSKDEILVALAVHVVTSLRDGFSALASSMDMALASEAASAEVKSLAPRW